MEEKFIRNRLYYKLACLMSDTNQWHVDDFLAHAFAILYPYVRDNQIDQEEKLSLPFQAIRTIRKGHKERILLDSLSEQSLTVAIKERWIPNIGNKEEIAFAFALIDGCDESGRILVREKIVNSYKGLSVPHSDMPYGTCEYFPQNQSEKKNTFIL